MLLRDHYYSAKKVSIGAGKLQFLCVISHSLGAHTESFHVTFDVSDDDNAPQQQDPQQDVTTPSSETSATDTAAISAVYRLLWRLFDCLAHWRRPCAVRPFSILWKLRRCCCCDGERLSTVPYTHNYGSSSVWLVCHLLRTYWQLLVDFLTWLTLLFYVHFNFLQF